MLINICLLRSEFDSFVLFTGNMVKIYPRVAGKTLGCDVKLLERIKKKGAKVVESLEESDVTVVFCPIVSRFETDVNEALTSLSGKHEE